MADRQARARGRVPLLKDPRRDEFVDILRVDGASISLAARTCGISPSAITTLLHEWRSGATKNPARADLAQRIDAALAEGLIRLHRDARERDGGGARWLLSRPGIGGAHGYGDRMEQVQVDGGQDHGAFWRALARKAVEGGGEDDGCDDETG